MAHPTVSFKGLVLGGHPAGCTGFLDPDARSLGRRRITGHHSSQRLKAQAVLARMPESGEAYRLVAMARPHSEAALPSLAFDQYPGEVDKDPRQHDKHDGRTDERKRRAIGGRLTLFEGAAQLGRFVERRARYVLKSKERVLCVPGDGCHRK